MLDERKYFDYELTYEGYEKIKKLFDKAGIEEIAKDPEFDISKDDKKQFSVRASDYNIILYLYYNKNKWNIGDIDIFSYGGGEDSLYITDKDEIQKRIRELKNYAKVNEYTKKDYEYELSSLIKVLNLINS